MSTVAAALLTHAFLFAMPSAPQAKAPASDQTPAKQPAQIKQPAEPETYPIEVKIVELTNQERVRHGLRPLRLDFRLLRSARRHTAWMTRQQILQHTNQPVGENIAMGQRSTKEVVQDWMNSPGHRANILNVSYTRIGVSAYRTPDGTIYWCQQFLR